MLPDLCRVVSAWEGGYAAFEACSGYYAMYISLHSEGGDLSRFSCEILYMKQESLARRPNMESM